MIFDKDSVLREMGFVLEVDRWNRGECPLCGDLVNIEDMTSVQRQEHKISGCCIRCQTDMFLGIENDPQDFTLGRELL